MNSKVLSEFVISVFKKALRIVTMYEASKIEMKEPNLKLESLLSIH